MSTLLSGRRAISAMQSPWRMVSSGSSRFAAFAGRKLVGCSAMRAIRFIALCPRYGAKVSQAGLTVKRESVNAQPKKPQSLGRGTHLLHNMLSLDAHDGLNGWCVCLKGLA